MTKQEQISKLQILLEKSSRIEEGIKQRWWKDVMHSLEGQVETLKDQLVYADDNEKSKDIKAEIKAIKRLFDLIGYLRGMREQVEKDLEEIKSCEEVEEE